MWKDKRSRTVKTILKKENEVERRTLYDFKAYCIAILLKTVILVEAQIQTSKEQNREPKKYPHKYALLIFYKDEK